MRYLSGWVDKLLMLTMLLQIDAVFANERHASRTNEANNLSLLGEIRRGKTLATALLS